LHTQDKQPLRGFVLQNEKGIQKEVKALIQKNQVIIPLQPNDQPRYVLYAWKHYTDANLINEDQLPASTFKIEIQ
jgi:sialate O-acetylesterase